MSFLCTSFSYFLQNTAYYMHSFAPCFFHRSVYLGDFFTTEHEELPFLFLGLHGNSLYGYPITYLSSPLLIDIYLGYF